MNIGLSCRILHRICACNGSQSPSSPRQLYFTDKAWHALCHRKELRQEHRSMQRGRHLLWLRFFFQGWRTASFQEEEIRQWEMATHLCHMQEAVVLEARRCADWEFKAAKKQDWKTWKCQQLQHCVGQLKVAKASEVFRILKPKKMVDRKRGRHRKPLPGLQDAAGTWRSSRADIALAWQCQFEIENAQKTHMQQLLSKSKPNSQPVMADQLLQLLTLYELEWAIRNMNPNKAAGVDGIGAEIWQAQTVETAMRLFPLLLK